MAAAKALELPLPHIGEQAPFSPGRIGRDRPRREKIADKVLPVAEGDALVFARQEPVAPARGAAAGSPPGIGHDDKGRQRVREITETIGQPAAKRWKPVDREAAV